MAMTQCAWLARRIEGGVPESRRLPARLATWLSLVGGAVTLHADLYQPGDVDCSGAVDFNDSSAFVTALSGPAGYASAYPECIYANADVDCSGAVDFNDIDPFVGYLVNGPVLNVELAGRPLSEYPHFEFTRLYNSSQPIWAAIDPTRFPHLAGRSVRLYVSVDRSAADWFDNPTLTDVRGAFTSYTIQPGGIENNLLFIGAGGALASATVETGFDLVIDANRNGRLDAGDLIDGADCRVATAGFSVMRSLTTPGPRPLASTGTYSVGPVYGLAAGFTNQITVYPDDFGPDERVPLVVISHGSGDNLAWFDYLQRHVASYGYIAMSHANNVSPGIEAASNSVLGHTEALLAQQIDNPILAGINGHIDTSRIVWIGQGRGGEGAVRAYDRITDTPPTYTPTTFSPTAIQLISAIAPTEFLGPASTNPKGVAFHLIYGAGDGVVTGEPGSDPNNPFNIFERAWGPRQSNYIHGADYGDFSCCANEDYVGPSLGAIGRSATQAVARAQWIALLEHYLRERRGMKDLLWRPYEVLRAGGAPASAIVVSEYRPPSGAGVFVLDDFQTQPSPSLSSSGGAVSFTLAAGPFEAVLNDINSSFAFNPGEVMNGMTRARAGEPQRGMELEHAPGGVQWLEFALPTGVNNLARWDYLSFRAAQVTRHPLTTAALQNQDFSIVLRDRDGSSSRLPIGAYFSGIQEPFGRSGSGIGFGWQNEFQTVRIRLTDFTHDRPELNLRNIVALRFEFGHPGQTPGGRLAFDDIRLESDLER